MQKSVFMHSLHYKNIPYALSFYCQRPEHRYSTRYKMSENYALPNSITNLGQSSIKYAGPKAWEEVPLKIKEIAYRKPFSKALKEHTLKQIFVELPPRVQCNSADIDTDPHDDLRALFESSDDEEDFQGFFNTSQSVRLLFESDEEGDFLGFTNPPNSPELSQIFLEESYTNEFYGF